MDPRDDWATSRAERPRKLGFARTRHIPNGNALLPTLVIAALLALTACGGGGGGGSGTATNTPTDLPSNPPSAPPDPPARNLSTNVPASRSVAAPILPNPADAALAPIIRFSNATLVGAMPPPKRSDLGQLVVTHATTAIRYGRISDGLGAQAMFDYMSAAFRGRPFRQPPVVRFVEGTTSAQAAEIVRAVQLINGNLPRNFQLTINPTPISAADDAANEERWTLGRNQILVEYDRRENWRSGKNDDDAVGLEVTWVSSRGATVASRVWVDPTRITDSSRIAVLMHELLHSLDFRHTTFETILNYDWIYRPNGYVMYQRDREALLAAYGPSGIASALGPWEDESIHARGDLGNLAFGASSRNGLVRSWAFGPPPSANLADNASLSGSVSWSGRLLGLTPEDDKTVAAAAGLTVDLASLRGDLDFTRMEYWVGRPGALGTGAMWGDGDLDYDIEVRGNGFSRRAGAGSDEGIITGRFFGDSHQGMGGTLVRDDLSAGFAGMR